MTIDSTKPNVTKLNLTLNITLNDERLVQPNVQSSGNMWLNVHKVKKQSSRLLVSGYFNPRYIFVAQLIQPLNLNMAADRPSGGPLILRRYHVCWTTERGNTLWQTNYTQCERLPSELLHNWPPSL